MKYEAAEIQKLGTNRPAGWTKSKILGRKIYVINEVSQKRRSSEGLS